MKVKIVLAVVLLTLCLFSFTSSVQLFAQAPQDGRNLLRDYTAGPGWFPNFLSPYREHPIAPTATENSSRLRNLIHDGKLELSLVDALALAIENNLDISVQRFVVPMSQTDVLRTKAG